MRVRIVCIALAACLALSLQSLPAAAAVPPTKCGKIEVGGKVYRVKSHLTKCRFARRWSRRILKGSDGPDGWSCERYSKRESSIALSCRKPGKDFFAIRK